MDRDSDLNSLFCVHITQFMKIILIKDSKYKVRLVFNEAVFLTSCEY
jgi:hypothetical protein